MSRSTAVPTRRASRGSLSPDNRSHRAIGALTALGGRPVLVVGGIVVVAALVTAWFTTRINGFEPDELGYSRIAIAIGDRLRTLVPGDPAALSRLNLLYPLSIAPYYALFDNVAAAKAAHAWNALLMASSAVPAYLLGRALVPQRWAAYLLAALVVASPWMTMASVQMTEVAAFPASLWAVVAMQRALATPSWRRDALALLAIGVAAYARLQLVVLAPAFIAVVVLHEFGFAFGTALRGGRRAALSAAGRRLLVEHRLLSVVAVVGVVGGSVALASGMLVSSFGFYGNVLEGSVFPRGTLPMAHAFLTFIAIGVGVVPLALSLGMIFDSLVSPDRRDVHAFAVLLAIVGLVLTVQVGAISARFTPVVQERYLMFIGPLLLAGMLAGLLETRRPGRAVLVGTAAVVVLIATTEYRSTVSAFWYLVSPGMTSFFSVIGPRLGRLASAFGMGDAGRLELMAAATALVGVVSAVALARLSRQVVAAALGTLVLLFCVGETVHALSVLTGSSGLGAGAPKADDWIDRAVGDGVGVTMVAAQTGATADAQGRWWTAEYQNRSLSAAYGLGGPQFTWNAPRGLGLRRADGRLAAETQPALVVAATAGVPLMPAGRVVRRSSDGTLTLIRASRPLRASWAVANVSDAGWLAWGHPAIVRAYMLRAACGHVAVTIALSAAEAVAAPVVIRTANTERRVVLAPGARSTARLPVCGGDGGVPEVSITALGPSVGAGATVPPRLEAVSATSDGGAG